MKLFDNFIFLVLELIIDKRNQKIPPLTVVNILPYDLIGINSLINIVKKNIDNNLFFIVI